MHAEDNRPREQKRDALEQRSNSTPGRHDPRNYDPAQVETAEERWLREWELAARDVSGRLLDQPDDPANWGLLLYVAQDSSADQQATFHWFEARDDLFEWVRTALPLNARRFVNADARTLRRQVEALADQTERLQIERGAALEELNGILESYCTLEWWGPLQDLLASPGEFERTLRLWYRETREQDDEFELDWGGVAPISADEMDDFIEMLRRFR